MKIISPFKDYYDDIQKFEMNKDVLYIRKTSEHWMHIPRLDWQNNSGYKWSKNRYILGFCGNLIHFAEIRKEISTYYSYVTKIVYDYTDIPTPTKWSWCESIVDFFEKCRNELFERFGPIFLIETSHFHEKAEHLNSISWGEYSGTARVHTIKVTKNPKLIDIGFNKVKNPRDAYIEIFKYLSNIAKPEKPIPEMSNEDKIILAGFDKKTSFRKEKQK